MMKFIDMPHGYAFDVTEILYYQVLRGDGFNPDIEYREVKDGMSNEPTKMIIHFKNRELTVEEFSQKLDKLLGNKH